MKHTFSLSIFILLLSALFQACQSNDEPTPEPVETYPLETPRSVLVYMVANNNLGNEYSRYDVKDSIEMQAALDTVKGLEGELLVFRAPYKNTPVLLRLRPNQCADTLVTYSDPNFQCLSESGMKQVLDDSRRFVKAKEHGLILWSHGTGWVQDGVEDVNSRLRSYGMDGSMKMNVTSLASVLESGYNFDWLYFDCCYMNSIEVAYQLRNAVPLIVGSVTELPAEGMPYHRNVPCFLKAGGADLVQAARNTFEWYDSKEGSDRTCTMSVIETKNLPALAAAVKEIYQKCDPSLPTNYTPQRFENVSVSSCKFFDLDNYLEALCLDPQGTERFEGAQSALDNYRLAQSNAVRYNASTPLLWNSLYLTHCCGLSTYILRTPANVSYKNYDTLDWYSDVASNLNL
ncbi:MAG: hypothetical protein K2F99_03595 [Muribaculaceae bacterium]|nr:hypothetical protein [Muribaculaceae bacterium]